jgi:phosphoribosylformylglycinamidine synthase
MKARIFVTLKKGVLDPQGKAVLGALSSMGYGEAKDVRVGKYIEVTLDGSPKDAENRLKEMCEKILSNPVMEDYRIEIAGD